MVGPCGLEPQTSTVSFNERLGTPKRHIITISAKAYLGEYRLHTAVHVAESRVPRAQHYDDEKSSLIGDDTGWPNRIR